MLSRDIDHPQNLPRRINVFRVHRTYIPATELDLELELDSSLSHRILHDPTVQTKRRDMHRLRFSFFVRISSVVTLTSQSDLVPALLRSCSSYSYTSVLSLIQYSFLHPILSFLNYRSAKLVHCRFLEE